MDLIKKIFSPFNSLFWRGEENVKQEQTEIPGSPEPTEKDKMSEENISQISSNSQSFNSINSDREILNMTPSRRLTLSKFRRLFDQTTREKFTGSLNSELEIISVKTGNRVNRFHSLNQHCPVGHVIKQEIETDSAISRNELKRKLQETACQTSLTNSTIDSTSSFTFENKLTTSPIKTIEFVNTNLENQSSQNETKMPHKKYKLGDFFNKNDRKTEFFDNCEFVDLLYSYLYLCPKAKLPRQMSSKLNKISEFTGYVDMENLKPIMTLEERSDCSQLVNDKDTETYDQKLQEIQEFLSLNFYPIELKEIAANLGIRRRHPTGPKFMMSMIYFLLEPSEPEFIEDFIETRRKPSIDDQDASADSSTPSKRRKLSTNNKSPLVKIFPPSDLALENKILRMLTVMDLSENSFDSLFNKFTLQYPQQLLSNLISRKKYAKEVVRQYVVNRQIRACDNEK